MPFKLLGSAMVTSPCDNSGVVLIGGRNQSLHEISDSVIELRYHSKKWKLLDQKLQNPRCHHIAIPAPMSLFQQEA